jgi:predicted ATPase/class 3 adenylate cyclase/DNA-binding CsgD family transcriptional regulator
MVETTSTRLPTGTVTFLLTDIAGSTRGWEADPDAMGNAVRRHYEILADAIAAHDGARPVEQGEGDSVVAVFERASDAAAAALSAQRALNAEPWSTEEPVRVRMAIHTGEAELRDEDNYAGSAIIRAARLRSLGHGGQTLVSRTAADLSAGKLPEGATLRDLGRHRLRDLGRPEGVYQLCHPALDDDFPPLRSLDALPNNLPPQMTSFIGRESELRELSRMMSEARLVTLTGAGGCGKSRLALQTAADSLDAFPDGVWWVELAPLTDARLVAPSVMEAISLQDDPTKDPLERLATYLGDQQALVTLDNCEHLIDAAAEVAAALVSRCPNVSVLATSRESLDIPGEVAWRVPPLSLPTAEASTMSFESLDHSDAVRLFLDRAQKARPNFSMTDRVAPAVVQTCRRLDGIPLAIELAAARVRVLSPDQIAGELDNRFRLLTGGSRSVVPRHRTLEASVRWSHDLLSDDERTLFRRLSVFSGGFTLDATEAVCSEDGLDPLAVLDLLTQLVDKSLVLVDDHDPDVRYRLLETIRQYGQERLLEAGEGEAVRARHVAFFTTLVESLEPDVERRPQAGALDVLEAEHDNIRGAVDWALAAEDADAALRLTGALAVFWHHRAHYREALAAYDRALGFGGPAPSRRGKAVWGSAYVAQYASDYERAYAGATEAEAIGREVQDLSLTSRALNVRGIIEAYLDVATGTVTLEEGIDLARQAGDDWCLADTLQLLASAWIFQERYDDSRPLLDEAAMLAERMGNRYFIAWHGALVGICDSRRGRLEEADRWTELGLQASTDVGEPSTYGNGMWQRVVVLLAEGRLDDARDLVEQSTGYLRRSHGLFVDETLACSLGNVALFEGDIAGARSHFGAAVESARASGAAYITGTILIAAAGAALIDGDLDAARSAADEAATAGAQLGNPWLAAGADAVLGRAARADGDLDQAEDLAHRALRSQAEHGYLLDVVDTLEMLAGVAALRESFSESARLFGATEAIRRDIGYECHPATRPSRDADIALARLGLGDDAFDHSVSEGRSLSVQDAVAYASRARGERKRPSVGWDSLTPTEIEVVRLAAQGLTNPVIGEQLFISPGTVKTHLSHVFAKLGLANRSELAAEAVRRGL